MASQEETAVSQEAPGTPHVGTVEAGTSPISESPGMFDFDQLEMSMEMENKDQQDVDARDDDDVSIADSEDVPRHVDSGSEEETEPEWVKRKTEAQARAPPPPIDREWSDMVQDMITLWRSSRNFRKKMTHERG